MRDIICLLCVWGHLNSRPAAVGYQRPCTWDEKWQSWFDRIAVVRTRMDNPNGSSRKVTCLQRQPW